jgi:hypothetical protein
MPVVGIAQAMAGGASRQDRGVEGGGAKHQLPRRRAAQLLVQLLQADRGAHRSSLQLGLIHHHPHISVDGSEVARPAPARAAVAAHRLAAHQSEGLAPVSSMVSLRPQTIFKYGHSYLDKNGDGATRGPFTPIDPIIGRYGYEHHAPPIADPAPAGCGPGRWPCRGGGSDQDSGVISEGHRRLSRCGQRLEVTSSRPPTLAARPRSIH